MMIVSYEYYIGIEEGECSPSKVHSCYFLTHFPALLERPSFPFQEQANIWQPKGPSHALVVTVDASGHSNRSANTWWCPPKCLDKNNECNGKNLIAYIAWYIDGGILNHDSPTAVVRQWQDRQNQTGQVEVPQVWNSHYIVRMGMALSHAPLQK